MNKLYIVAIVRKEAGISAISRKNTIFWEANQTPEIKYAFYPIPWKL